MDSPAPQGISYSEFIALTNAPKDQRHIEEVEIKDRDYTFTVKGPKGESKHRTVGPVKDDDAAAELVKKGIKVSYQKDDGSPFVGPVLTILLPMLFVIVMFYLRSEER